MGDSRESDVTSMGKTDAASDRPSRRPRLFIKEMVLRNFKSYAGEQRIGPFHKSFSAVVGPNGSGKSNVIDAMLFVFGKRAKQMRLNKVSELIHNSSNHQNLDSAGVLESLNDKRSGVVQMVKLAEKEKDNLENVKNEAEAFMLKELAHMKWQEKATKLALDDSSSNLTDFQANVHGLEQNWKEEREKFNENVKSLKELEAIHNKYLKQQEELDNDLRSCKEEFKEFERQDVKYREDLKHTKQKIKKLQDKIEKDSSKIDEIHKKTEEANILIPKHEQEISQLQQTLMEEEKILEEIKELSKVDTEKYRMELTEVRAQLEPWEKQLIGCKGRLDVASAESKLLKEKHDAGRKAFEDAEHQMMEIADDIRSKTADILKIQTNIDENKRDAFAARKEEQDLIRTEESLIPLEQAARQKVAELHSALESEQSQGSVLKAILQAQESKQIDGIYGRLGDLGAIDAKYDVAISTACSGLDYVVVETTLAAQACVELLRSRNLGIATFMILEKQEVHLPKLKGKVNTPEGVPRLFDLIKVQNERIKLAFYAVLGNTVVAQNLDQATRIAYGENKEFRRVVTLEGALFEKSGTMSGGGGKPRGGKMGTSIKASVSTEAVVNAEKELALLVDQLAVLRQKIVTAGKRYQASEKALANLEIHLAKTQMEIETLNARHSDMEKQLPFLKNESLPKKAEAARLAELDKIISYEEKELSKLVTGSKGLKDKAFELQSKIENAGGEKLKIQKLKVEKLQSDIDKLSTEINQHKVQITTGQKMVKKLTKSVEESTREKEKSIAEKDNMIAGFKVVEQKAFVVQENYQKTQELIEKHKDVLDSAKEEYSKLKKATDALRTAEVDVEFKLQDAKKLLKDCEMKAKGYKKKLEEIQRDILKHLEQLQVDGIEAEKVQMIINDESLSESCDLSKAREMVTLLEAQLKEMKPNLDSISEYRKKATLYNVRVEELNAVTLERDDIKRQYDELRTKRQMITLGGDAELELVDSLDPFSEGVVFSVRPPKKSWKNIANLSGGEKTLSSLALVFALHHYKPTPLYVMDEIDAALDFKNVSIVGHYVKDRTKDAQFIIISLRNNMFELADRLIGIYKTENCTKSITINPGSFAQKAF
ncbi:Structural maintenance of chromosomes protein 4 [Nymphaea thermarum]|nr:Structural maintenance of chromosomes protein 4 [Nymphaea thermarum]